MNRKIKQLPEDEINKLDLFIKGWYIDHSVCDQLIDLFESHKQFQFSGLTGPSINNNGVYVNSKDSTDINSASFVNIGIDLSFYENSLWECLDLYNEKLPASAVFKYGILTPWNIQKYNPGGGFKIWHSERGADDICIRRHLVFMTYLNDVTDEGGTAFLHQNLTLTPKKGLTVIWPADWTYTHKGVVSNTQTKYIATGWLSFLPEDMQYDSVV